MLYSQRQEAILAAIRKHGAIEVTEISVELNVSQMTVRRDINLLAEKGLVVRIHGGATLPSPKASAGTRAGDAAMAHDRAGHLVLGMVVPAATHYHRQLIQGARAAAEALGVRLSLGVSCYDLDEDRVQAERLLDNGVDGLLLTPSTPLGEASGALGWMNRLPVPVTVVERRRDPRAGLDHADYISSDHEQGALIAARHLHALGHRRIALLSCPTPTSDWIARGLDTASDVFGLSRGVPRVLDHAHGDTARVETFLDEVVASRVTAVLVHPDDQAILLVESAQGRGLTVPGDLAVVAYDDDIAGLASVPLTAVEPPRHAVGSAAVRLLVQRLRKSAAHVPQQTLLTPRVNVRASTAP